MSFNEVTRFYPLQDFIGLTGPIQVDTFITHLSDVSFDVPIINLSLSPFALRVDWSAFPSEQDLLTLDAKVASYTGGATTHERVEVESLGVDINSTDTPETKLEYTTQALDEGVYLVCWNCEMRMQAEVQNSRAEVTMRVTRSDSAYIEQVESWILPYSHAFNGSFTIDVAAGLTLHALLSFVMIGASGTAEVADAQITIDRIKSE